jgi:hypothetical protein
MSIEQLVDDLAAMRLLTDDGLAQLPVGFAPGVLDPAEVGPETGRQGVDLANTLRSLGTLQCDEFALLDGGPLVLELGELAPRVGGAAPAVGIQARLESLDLSLHHR